jgi:hypothetical protein
LRSNGHHPVREPQRLDDCQALEGRRLNGQIRCHQRGTANRFDVRWPVDDRAINITCDDWVKRIARDRYDGEPARECPWRMQFGPLPRAAVGVVIDDGDTLPLAAPDAGEMQRQSRLADSALLVEERDDHGARPRRRAEPHRGFPAREGSPTTKNLDSGLKSLDAPDSPPGESVSGSLCARSPDREAPEIPISVATEVPIAADEIHSLATEPEDGLCMRMSSQPSWRSSASR